MVLTPLCNNPLLGLLLDRSSYCQKHILFQTPSHTSDNKLGSVADGSLMIWLWKYFVVTYRHGVVWVLPVHKLHFDGDVARGALPVCKVQTLRVHVQKIPANIKKTNKQKTRHGIITWSSFEVKTTPNEIKTGENRDWDRDKTKTYIKEKSQQNRKNGQFLAALTDVVWFWTISKEKQLCPTKLKIHYLGIRCHI